MTAKTKKTNATEQQLNGSDLEQQVQAFEKMFVMRQAFEATNMLIAIANNLRQIVYANKAFLKMVGSSKRGIVGKKPGEAIHCIHADTLLGCGASEACKFCDALNTVLESIGKDEETSSEVAIMYKRKSQVKTLNFLEHVSPMKVNSEKYYVLSLLDISDTVRRRALERIFFHDIINTTGALGGYIHLIKKDSPAQLKPDMEFVEKAFGQMVEEIILQRQLTDAENGELKLNNRVLHSCDIMLELIQLYEKHEISLGKKIKLDGKSACIEFSCDYIILKRILENMLKNALEASNEGDSVIFGCKKIIDVKKSIIEFQIKNERVIPDEIKHQIFKRSFSTKEIGRGQGTYSMKLFGEQYLNGKVGFRTNKRIGTIFYIQLPIKITM